MVLTPNVSSDMKTPLSCPKQLKNCTRILQPGQDHGEGLEGQCWASQNTSYTQAPNCVRLP